VTNIRLIDLDRDRAILHIKEGKGRVDRIVPISAKVWEKIDEYMESYSPVKYLFEGQTGGSIHLRVFTGYLRQHCIMRY